ncbi:phage terminase large subunit family protein [Maritalea porphyrae]|uniref:phage terminase large subunit family protein n=1 Tax=Maritalea porphyrae TaxID=880732 RepID=UPI0022AF3117|nr:terminase gpA endonuclease subunit [Maritalea porphyrae]MCZ4270728.1 phage terminase large subunit family protein [Maritalea porphyrae]
MSKPLSAKQRLASALRKSLTPPERLIFSEWAKQNFRLNESSAAAGKYRPWKKQRGILDTMGDPLVPIVTVRKATRTGYTTCMTAAIGAQAASDPCPMLLYMPTDEDAREIMVDDIDPAFQSSPSLQGLMPKGRMDAKNTLTRRHFVGGGRLFALGAATPKNFRRHTGRVIYIDEIDGFKMSVEGDSIKIIEKRALSYADSKFIYGSTPTLEDTSIIQKLYLRGDQRVFEMMCPHCEDRSHFLFEHLGPSADDPENIVANCPSCGCEIDEKHKPWMEENGDWRATVPENSKNSASFWDSAISSLHPKATWAYLVKEFKEAEALGPFDLMVFYNTLLGLPWSGKLGSVSEEILLSRRETFGLTYLEDESRWREEIPREVMYITCGIDVQGDRVEAVLVGWSDNKQRYFLGHHVIYGLANDDSLWEEVDAFLSTRWRHPLGGTIGIDATAIDSGNGNHTQYVYDFCFPRFHRRIYAIKGDDGFSRPFIEMSKRKGQPLFIVGADSVKLDISLSLPNEFMGEAGSLTPGAFRYSDSLNEEWFRQFNSERRSIEYVKGRAKEKFVRIENRQAEALDAAVYAIAVKNLLKIDFPARLKSLLPTTSKKEGGFDFGEYGANLNG